MAVFGWISALLVLCSRCNSRLRQGGLWSACGIPGGSGEWGAFVLWFVGPVDTRVTGGERSWDQLVGNLSVAMLVLQTPFPATVSISCSIDCAAQLCIISKICQQSPAFVLRLLGNIVTKITLQPSFRGALLVDCLLVNNSLFSYSHYSLPFSLP